MWCEQDDQMGSASSRGTSEHWLRGSCLREFPLSPPTHDVFCKFSQEAADLLFNDYFQLSNGSAHI